MVPFFQRRKNLQRCMKLNWNFQRRGSHRANPFCRGYVFFSENTHLCSSHAWDLDRDKVLKVGMSYSRKNLQKGLDWTVYYVLSYFIFYLFFLVSYNRKDTERMWPWKKANVADRKICISVSHSHSHMINSVQIVFFYVCVYVLWSNWFSSWICLQPRIPFIYFSLMITLL